jgi:medium-chain acyl-[acyl-carrier-protein] hydrolase
LRNDTEFIEGIRDIGGTPKEVLDNPGLLRLVMPMLRADVAMNLTYRYSHESPLACPITAYMGDEDAFAERGDVDAWREQTAAEFRLMMLHGGHFFVRTARSDLLRCLCSALDCEFLP